MDIWQTGMVDSDNAPLSLRGAHSGRQTWLRIKQSWRQRRRVFSRRLSWMYHCLARVLKLYSSMNMATRALAACFIAAGDKRVIAL